MTAATDRLDATGLLLAAGGGRRMGSPKALLTTSDGESWLGLGVRTLRAAGCPRVVVVLGAAYDEALSLVPKDDDVDVVRAVRWEDGMGESLRVGLRHLRASEAHAAVVTLVDLPDVGPEVVGRVLDRWAGHPHPRSALVRAVYGGSPGHPVVLGRDHWDALLESAAGDVGAQPYLTRVDIRRTVDNVECADLATGRDVDRPSRSET